MSITSLLEKIVDKFNGPDMLVVLFITSLFGMVTITSCIQVVGQVYMPVAGSCAPDAGLK